MSITIRINNDTDLSQIQEWKCDCLNYNNGKPLSTCKICKGTGKETYKYSKWEMNMANANFSSLWNALGFCGGLSGEMYANKILKAIESFRPELATRANRVESNIYDCGIDIDYVNDKIRRLKEIAMEAAKREELIYWS